MLFALGHHSSAFFLLEMKFVRLLLNIICIKCCLSISKLNSLQMIVDVITSYEQPTSLVANVCWKTCKLTIVQIGIVKYVFNMFCYLLQHIKWLWLLCCQHKNQLLCCFYVNIKKILTWSWIIICYFWYLVLLKSGGYFHKTYNQSIYLVFLICLVIYEYLLLKANTKNFFSKQYRWLILGNANVVMEQFADLNILVDSEFIIAEERDSGNFTLQTGA